MSWTCPGCQRHFGRQGQSHECSPAMSLDDYFASGPPVERPVFEAVRAHLETVGPVIVEAVSVGILFKRTSTFAELRPKSLGRDAWVALSFGLARRLDHARIARRLPASRSGGRTYHYVNLRSADEVDALVCDWLTESYLASAPGSPAGGATGAGISPSEGA